MINQPVGLLQRLPAAQARPPLLDHQVGVLSEVDLDANRYRRFKAVKTTIKLLNRHGIRTREEAREKRVLRIFQNEPNCGDKTLREISCWLDDSAN